MKASILRLVALFIVCTVFFGLAGCGNKSTTAAVMDDSDLQPLTVRYAHGSSLDHPIHLSALQMKEYVERESGGRITVEIFPNSQLGGERELVEQVKNGSLEFGMTTVGPLTTFNSKMMVLDIPFLFNTCEEAWMILDSNVGIELLGTLKDENLYCMSWVESGFRHITNNVRPIETPADLQGLKIRTMEAPMHMANFTALGANPTPIPWPELYMAMSQKLADGQENPLANIWDIKLYEVQSYLTLSGHLYDTGLVVANNTWFASQPLQYQKILKEGFLMAQSYSRFLQYNRDLELVSYLAEKGMEVTELTAEQKAAFANVSQQVVIDKVKEELEPAFVDQFLEDVDRLKAEIMQGVIV